MERLDRFVVLFTLSLAGVFAGAGLASILGITDYAVTLVAIGGGIIIGLAALAFGIYSRRTQRHNQK